MVNGCRTFTGAWIETPFGYSFLEKIGVAPLRVRELKHIWENGILPNTYCRTFTGAWIETFLDKIGGLKNDVAPLRVRELKLKSSKEKKKQKESHLYGCVNWNFFRLWLVQQVTCRTFTGAWIETDSVAGVSMMSTSHLYGCVNWNKKWISKRRTKNVAPLRVRELKRVGVYSSLIAKVAPLRVRELKRFYHIKQSLDNKVAPLRVRELKLWGRTC